MNIDTDVVSVGAMRIGQCDSVLAGMISAISFWNDQVGVLVGCLDRHILEVEALAVQLPQNRWFWSADIWQSDVDACTLSEFQILTELVSLIEFRL